MTLLIQSQEDDQRQLSLTVEVPEDRVKKAMQEKARQLSQKINFPGFRRGKVPYHIVIKLLGEDSVRAEAADDMVQELYKEALTQLDVQPYAPGQVTDMDLQPLVLKITVPLEPTVALGDYRHLQKELEEVNVTEEALADALQRIQKRHQILEPVETPAEAGHVVTLKGEGRYVTDNADEQGDVFFEEESIDFALETGELYYGQAFIDQIVGMSVDESKTFTITLPADEDAAEEANEEETPAEAEAESEKAPAEPKQGQFTVTVLAIKSRTIPELSDELAKEEGDYESLEDLQAAVRADLQKAAEETAKNKMIDEMMDELFAQATILYPPAAVELELDSMVENLKNRATRAGWQWEDYLKLQGETEKSLRDSWRSGATEQMKRSLILRHFVEEERLRITPEEIDNVFEIRYGDMDESLKSSMRRFFSESAEGFSMLTSELLMDKVAERVRDIRLGNPPDLDALEEEEEKDLSEEE